MATTITVASKLTWSGKAVFKSFYFSSADLAKLFIAQVPVNDPLSVSPVSVDKAKFKYKKQIEADICDGFFSGTVSVGTDEIDWEWDPEFEVDGVPIDKDGIEDFLEDIAGSMLDSEEAGVVQIPVDYTIDLSVTAKAGKLAMGEVTVESMDILDIYENCSFATDGNDVIFDEELKIPEPAMKKVKQAIVEETEAWK